MVHSILPGDLVVLRSEKQSDVSDPDAFCDETIAAHGVGIVVGYSDVPPNEQIARDHSMRIDGDRPYVLVVWSGPDPVDRFDFDNHIEFFEVVGRVRQR